MPNNGVFSGISKTQMLSLQKQYGNDSQIAKYYSVTRQAVHQKRKALGVPSLRADTPSRNKKIIDSYQRGKSGVVIAKKFCMSTSQVYRILKEAGVTSR